MTKSERWYAFRFENVQEFYNVIAAKRIFEARKEVRDKVFLVKATSIFKANKLLAELKVPLTSCEIVPAYEYRKGWVK